jgi:hypothetical protein
MSVRRVVTAGAAALATGWALTACGSGTSSSPTSDHSGPVASPPHTIATGSATSEPSPSPTSVGSPDHPAVAAVGQAPLQWTPVPGSTEDLVTVGDGWTLTVPRGGGSARLAGPHPRTIRAGDHASVTDAFLDEHHALVVSEDRQANEPDRATLVDLDTGAARVLDARSQPATVVGAQLTPLPGVTDCTGWDSALLDGTTIWSVVQNAHRIDAAHFYAHTDSGWWDLGPGTSGSLVTCDGSAYFTRDPGSRSDPATLLRWAPGTASLTIAFASKGTGNAFLSPPRCGGTHLTVTAYSQAGDEQVTTDLG